jgi:VWFA-related protein
VRARCSPHFRFVTSPLLLCLFAFLAFSQEKPRLKDFGSSLKKLKWDAKQNTTVETKDKSKTPAKSIDEVDVVKVETSLVVGDVLVLDQRGNSVPGLTEKDFLITEEGKPEQVGMFSAGDNTNVPRSIVLVIDYSGSQFPFIGASVAAAKSLVDKLSPKDRMAIVTDRLDVLTDFTSDKQQLKDRLQSLERKSLPYYRSSLPERGRGNVYSSLMATLREAFAEDLRPIIIVQTDGDDIERLRNPIITPTLPANLPAQERDWRRRAIDEINAYNQNHITEFSLDDVYKAAEHSRATIYTITPGWQLIGVSPAQEIERYRAWQAKIMLSWTPPGRREIAADRMRHLSDEDFRIQIEEVKKMQSALALLATITGGWANFFSDPAEADEIYSRIFSDINRRYLVGYYPTNKEHDGKRRKINIEVRGHPEYIVMMRKAYYAPSPDQ